MALFMAIYWSAAQAQLTQTRERFRVELVRALGQQTHYFRNEVLLSQSEALTMRQETIIAQLKSQFPEAELCFAWRLNGPYQRVKAENDCSAAAGKNRLKKLHVLNLDYDEVLFGEVQIWGELQVDRWDGLMPRIAFAAVGSLAFAAFLGLYLISRLHTRIVEPLLDEIQSSTTTQAMTATIQAVAHDVRAPFTSIRILAELIRSTKPEEHAKLVESLLPHIEEKRQQVETLLRSLLQTGRETSLEINAVMAGQLVKEAMGTVFQGDAKVRIALCYDGSEARLQVDPAAVRRALENILFNAKHATGPGGQITVTVRPSTKRRMVEIAVRNTGSFIPEEEREKIFDYFYTYGKRRGTGIGLALVRKTAMQHGGSVTCDSDQSRGTEFRLALPGELTHQALPVLPSSSDQFDLANSILSESSSAATAPEALSELVTDGGGVINLLVVDDEALYAKAISEMVGKGESGGKVRVTQAPDARLALELVGLHDYDAVIVDVDLGPDSIDGLSLTAEIRRLRPDVPICLHSNRTSAEIYNDGIRAGADLFLPKPFDHRHLMQFLAMRKRA